MATSIERNRGRSKNYKLDRGGVPAEFGPFYGVVKNTNDSIRSGRMQVFIDTFSDGNADDENNPEKWTANPFSDAAFLWLNFFQRI